MPGVGQRTVAASFALFAVLLAGCTSVPTLPTAKNVDLDRFMGDWYVIANIPTFVEKGAHNAVESYRRNADGTIATTFTFNKDAFDGPRKVMNPKGFVTADPAIWGMQFVWPIKAEYLIVHVDDAHTETIIGRSALDYLWIMARTPTIPAADYDRLVNQAVALGYDRSKIQRIPQQPRP